MSKIVKIAVTQENGVVHHTEDPLIIKQIVESFPKGVTLKKSTDIETLHNKFFAMENELWKAVNNGDSKQLFHEGLKPLLMQKFLDYKHYFTTNQPEYSTRNLNVEGYSALIEELKHAAKDIFDLPKLFQ